MFDGMGVPIIYQKHFYFNSTCLDAGFIFYIDQLYVDLYLYSRYVGSNFISMYMNELGRALHFMFVIY